MKKIEITARKNGFRRCGMAHADTPTEHEAERFTDAELEILKNDPMLMVREVAAKPRKSKSEDAK